MTTLDQLRLTRHDAAEARALSDRLIAVYAEVYADSLDKPFFGVDRFTERFAAHSGRPGYALVAAHVGDEMVGYAYGLPLAADTAWWTGLVDPVPAEATRETGHRTFALNEIMVRAPWRRQGLGRRLHDALLAGRTEPRATLLVDPTNIPAKAAYASWGWRRLGGLRPFPDAPTYDAMLLARQDA